MVRKNANSTPAVAETVYWGADVPMRLIRRFARAVGKKFQPDMVVLFGSHAYGTPHADSDVDILVVMPARDKHGQAVRIRLEVEAPFPMDLLVRTPREIESGLQEGNSFVTEIISKGKILYESRDPRMGAKGGGRLPRRQKPRPKPTASS